MFRMSTDDARGSRRRTSAESAADGAAPSRPARAKRPDAQRNRERILRAAYAVFAESGVDAQMTDIAAAAGVGVATLYRNFRTKEDLVNALLHEHFTRAVEVTRDAVQASDPWQGLVQFFRWLTSLQLEDRALSQFFAGRIEGSETLQAERTVMYDLLADVAQQAKEAGQLREDIQVSDLRTIMVSVALLAGTEFPDRIIRRLVSVIIDGLRNPGHEVLEGPPFTMEGLDEALGLHPGAPSVPVRAFRRGRRPWTST